MRAVVSIFAVAFLALTGLGIAGAIIYVTLFQPDQKIPQELITILGSIVGFFVGLVIQFDKNDLQLKATNTIPEEQRVILREMALQAVTQMMSESRPAEKASLPVSPTT